MPYSLTTVFKRLAFPDRIDPERDWLVLLIISVLLLACIVVWNAWAFDRIANGGTIGPVATSTPSIIKPATLEDIHAIFDKRASEEASYVSGAYQYADPSL